MSTNRCKCRKRDRPIIEQKCIGEAHSNPYIDNCGVCAPLWGRILLCGVCNLRLPDASARRISDEQYRIRQENWRKEQSARESTRSQS